MTKISAFTRLRELDPVFSIGDLEMRHKWTNNQAQVMASRWAKQGLTQAFGRGVYFNLIVDPHGPDNRIEEALEKILNRPGVIVGGGALRRGGWTTQTHHRMEIAVPIIADNSTLPNLLLTQNIILTPRYPTWFNALMKSDHHYAPQRDRGGYLYVANPAMALADALLSSKRKIYASRQVHIPDPDELDMEELSPRDLNSVYLYLRLLGASESKATELLSPYMNYLNGGRKQAANKHIPVMGL